MTFLLIETSTERGIIALGDDSSLLFQQELPFGSAQSRFLMPELQKNLQGLLKKISIEAIAVGIGPGSYTGIRLGVSVAQALAYSWKLPLVGVCSLCGFVPQEKSQPFASIIDARISGAYVLRENEKEPHVFSLEQLGEQLQGITHLVTPYAQSLEQKLGALYEKKWVFEERAPHAQSLLQKAASNFNVRHNVVIPPQHLDLLYMRETEAERQRSSQLH